MTVVHVHTKDAPLRDPLGVHRGVTGLRAEIREALFEYAYQHTCPGRGDWLDDDEWYFDQPVIDLTDDAYMTELLDRLVAIAERGERT